MEHRATPLHRVAAWCAAALFLAAVAIGTRTAFRALTPDPAPEPQPVARAHPMLREVEEPRDERATDDSTATGSEPTDEAHAAPRSSASGRRPLWAPADEPMEEHPYFVIEGAVVSDTGSYRSRILMEVEHPGIGTAVTELHFDRLAPDGRSWIAPFKLIKPATNVYGLHVRIVHGWDYAIEPNVLRIGESVSDLFFHLRDDVEHVDLDVVVLGDDDEELPSAWCDLSVARPESGKPRPPSIPRTPCVPGAGPELERVPVGTSMSWLVAAPRHKPAWGEFVAASGQDTITVRLEPGWGAFLSDLSMSEETPPGTVWIDGLRVGPTDPSGVTFVETDAPPSELQVSVGNRWVYECSSERVNRILHHYVSNGRR